MANWLKILLFVTGGIVAAGGTAYVTGALDSWLAPEAPIVAAVPEAEPAARRDETAKPAGDPAIGGEVKADRLSAGETDDVVIPSFDIVRVEPDGSMVIAGHAAPGAAVEIVTGSRVIATAKSGDAGDFAAVLDEPLSPGDYQIVLRATTQDNIVATSPETAVVSVPETSDGQVLALVEEPGTPSRLITVPEPVEAPDRIDVAEPATGPEMARDEEPGELAASDESDTPAEVDTAEAGTAETDIPEAAEEAAEAETQIAEALAEAAQESPAEVEVTEAPAQVTETETATDEEPMQPETEQLASEEAPAEQDIAALPEAVAAESEATEPVVVEARIFVEAVEIDGDTVFVAGRAEAGRYVRVYANEIVLGETKASEGDRFLVEAKVDLPVGDYIIRADLLGSDGSVIARAAVPFEREPGEMIAAVAPAPGPAEDVAEAETAVEEEAIDEADVAVANGPVEGEAEPSIAEQPAAGPDASKTEEEIAAPVGPAEQPAIAEAEEAAPETEAGLAEAQPAPGEAEQMAAAPVEETMSPALERVDGAVIIRRGDNLWRISRRVYGHGIRYSTIYLANQSQIRNPDLIWPGQVFAVPAETEDGAVADLEALGEQAVDPSEIPGEIVR